MPIFFQELNNKSYKMYKSVRNGLTLQNLQIYSHSLLDTIL